MTARITRLLPLLAIVAALAVGSAVALAVGDSGEEALLEYTAEDILPGECQDGRCGPGNATSAVCAPGYPDCDDMIEPGDLVADCAIDIYPCYDTGGAQDLPSPAGCTQTYDDLVACVADPDAPVSSVPAEPPPDECRQLAEDIAARGDAGVEDPSAATSCDGAKPDGGTVPNSGDLVPPDECSAVHNVDACQSPGDPGAGSPPSSGDLVAPDECSLVHNVGACD